MQNLFRDAGLKQKTHRLGRHQRGLPGGFGEHRVAGGQRRHHLAQENRQREIPRRDAQEHAAAMEAELVALPGRALEDLRLGEFLPGLQGVIAAIVGGLAHLGKAVGNRFSRFAAGQVNEGRAAVLDQAGHFVENVGPGIAAQRIPGGLGGLSNLERAQHVFFTGLAGDADHHFGILRRGDVGRL